MDEALTVERQMLSPAANSNGYKAEAQQKDARIAELEKELAALKEQLAAAKEAQPAAKDETAETGTVDSARWRASTAAVCQAVIEVVRSGRTDWVKGASNGTDRDSAGDETFTALASRKYTGSISVMQEAENAAWQVLSDNNLTWKGGRKPSKQNSVNPTIAEGEGL